ncbi:DNA/RNA nuclease SfsA [Neptunicella marina]|uniref:Sugar fermentation stimulation protein homolog n=1 Tax=Neptunicella marina TaxID=2125989 RepID=A0A8J6LZB9_9ALTE|nr:DNA/RNA nuclease SfsA [Neptunicella marina]MBC3766010.1 DNA/RNA nuclease SfsA [Neptunicella marina]
MKFVSPLIPGTLIKRYKRFFADVKLDTGDIVTAHCPNTGSMKSCAEPGWKAWLSKHNNPKRKLAYTWELVENHLGHLIGINTHNANKLVAEAIQQNRIPELTGYDKIKPEVKYGNENSRIDFLLTQSNQPDCYVEVKSVTLLEQDWGCFPDAVTTRGQKHLRELAILAEKGQRAVLLFLVQHSGIHQMTVARHIDPAYAAELQNAIDAGVEILAYGCELLGDEYKVSYQCPFNLHKKVDF